MEELESNEAPRSSEMIYKRNNESGMLSVRYGCIECNKCPCLHLHLRSTNSSSHPSSSPPLLLLRIRTRNCPPLRAAETPILPLRANPQPLQPTPQPAKLILQPDPRVVICFLIHHLIYVRLRLAGRIGGVGRQGLGDEFDVQGGLHELREGDCG